MTREDFERAFSSLGEGYRTADVDRLNRQLIKERADLSCLRPLLFEHAEYYRSYFQVTLKQLVTKEDKMAFIEANFDLLQDWWHVDSIVSFLGNSLDFDYALAKAKEYILSDLPYVRRLGYVLFIPRLVRDPARNEALFSLFRNDSVYHVIMAEAWLLSFLAMADPDRIYRYLKTCPLSYAIVGKAIQKIADSYVVSAADKARFKALREDRKGYR